MHLSAQEEYGLRCLMRVARHDTHDSVEPIRTHEIAEAEGLTPEYVAKLMRVLRQGGLVDSTRGAAGGYRLNRPAARISVWEAINVLGGPLFPDGFCDTHPGTRRDCVHTADCSIRALWTGVSGLLRTALSAVTLDELTGAEGDARVWLTGGGFETNAAAAPATPSTSRTIAADRPIAETTP